MFTSKWSGNLSCFPGLCCFSWVRWLKSELGKYGSNFPLIPGYKPSMPWWELISSQVVLPPFWVRKHLLWWQHAREGLVCCRCHTYSCEMDESGALSLTRQCAPLAQHECLNVPLSPRQKCWFDQFPFSRSTGVAAVVDVLLRDCNSVTPEMLERPLGKGYPILTLIVTHPILHAVRSSDVPG